MSPFQPVLPLFSALLLGAGSAPAQDGFCMVNGTTTGGAGGTTYTVTNGTDFITHATATGPRIIQVQGALTIGSVSVKSDKSIIGIGTNAALLGRLSISGVSNIIVQNLRITSPGNDGITIRDPNTHHVWVDHVTFFDCSDGSCDISQNADYVTVSWCNFIYPTQLEHRFAMIADGQSGNTNSGRITLHHNWWGHRADQRMAASSYARVHYYNNYFNCTNNSYSSNARTDTEINSENNYYSGVKDPIGISSGTNGKIKTSGNTYAGCTGTIHPGTDVVFAPPYAYTPDATAGVPALVMAGAGAPGPETVTIPPRIWDGGGGDNNLNNASNWNFNSAVRAYDPLVFAGSTRLAPNNNFASGTEFPTLTFSNNAGAFVLDGNTVNVGKGITDDSAAVQTINLALNFVYGLDHYSMVRDINVTSPNGSLIINGSILAPPNTYGKAYSVTKLGPGLLTLAGFNTILGTFNFNGGLVRFDWFENLGTTNLAFNGGGLQWTDFNNTDISIAQVDILAGGATLDVGANDIIFANAIGVGDAGGLTKTGAGKLTLNGNNTYSGTTLINQGTLALGTAGTIPNSSRILLTNNATLDVSGRSDGTLALGNGKRLQGTGSVLGSVVAASGSTIAPGFSLGTLSITNVLTFQSNSTNLMELDATSHTNDLLTGMASVNYGGRLVITNLSGTLMAGDSFKLFSAGVYNNAFNSIVWPALSGSLQWSNRLALDGTIAVASSVSTTPTNITFSITEGTLQLSWPESHTGWRLEVQTNDLSVGLSEQWFPLGYQSTNAVSLPIGQDAGSCFYRLAYP
jgi:pectate lyase